MRNQDQVLRQLERAVEMYTLNQADPQVAAVAAEHHADGLESDATRAYQVGQQALAEVADGLVAKRDHYARALHDDGEDPSMLLTLVNRIEDGRAVDALVCADALLVQLERRRLRDDGEGDAEEPTLRFPIKNADLAKAVGQGLDYVSSQMKTALKAARRPVKIVKAGHAREWSEVEARAAYPYLPEGKPLEKWIASNVSG